MTDREPQKKSSWLPKAAIGAVVLALLAIVATRCSSGSDASETAARDDAVVSVRYATAERREVQNWIFAEGTARSATREYLTFQQAGKVRFIMRGLREGSRVEAGTLLASQDQRRIEAELTEARTHVEVVEAQLRQAETQAAIARRSFDRFESLLEKNSASQQEFDEAKARHENALADVARAESQLRAAKAQLQRTEVTQEETEIHAPVSGLVAYLNIEEGSYFMPSVVRTDTEQAALNTVPIVIIDPDRFQIVVDVPSFQRGLVEPGQPALVKAGAIPEAFSANPLESDAFLRGEVFSVSPAVGPSGRAIQVEIHVEGAAGALQDGMFVATWIQVQVAENALSIPYEGLLYRENEPFAFVIDPASSQVQRRKLVLALGGMDGVAVAEGVAAGEQIVTDGRHQLSDGTRVRLLDERSEQNPETR